MPPGASFDFRFISGMSANRFPYKFFFIQRNKKKSHKGQARWIGRIKKRCQCIFGQKLNSQRRHFELELERDGRTSHQLALCHKWDCFNRTFSRQRFKTPRTVRKSDQQYPFCFCAEKHFFNIFIGSGCGKPIRALIVFKRRVAAFKARIPLKNSSSF